MSKERAPINGLPVRSHSLSALLDDLEDDMENDMKTSPVYAEQAFATPTLPKPNPYAVIINGANIDVYEVLVAYGVTCPATAHAIKKLLCAGKRGGGKNRLQDLTEAQAALTRAIDLEMGE